MSKGATTSVLAGASAGEYISVSGLRSDGRRPHEIRRLRHQMGLFQRVDGSAYLEQGNTKVLAVIYGPRELHHVGSASNTSIDTAAVIQCELSQAPFATSERRFNLSNDRKRTEMGQQLQKAVEASVHTQLYPKSQIDVFVQIIQSDGSEMAASINAVTLALIDAGIALQDFVVAASVGFIQQTPLCDLNYGEENARAPQLTLAVNPHSRQIVLLHMESKLALEMLENLLDSCQEACQEVYETLENAVREHTWKRLRAIHTTLD